MKTLLMVVLSIAVGLTASIPAGAHCEIPCGIYDDPLRVSLLKEHADTIEKSIKMIAELSAAADKDYNQLIRWVDNKETHAGYVQDIVAQYFLTQRVKPAQPGDTAAYQIYIRQLTALHQIMVAAMKTKQSTEMQNVAALREAIDDFAEAYFHPEEKAPDAVQPAAAPAKP